MIPLIGPKNSAGCGGVSPPRDYATLESSENRKSLWFDRDDEKKLEYEMTVTGSPTVFTFFASFKLTSLPSDNGRGMEILSLDYAASDNIYSHFFIDSDNHLSFKCADIGKRIHVLGELRDTNGWYSMMGVRNGADLILWINGKSVEIAYSSVTTHSNNPFNTSGYKMIIGGGPDAYTSSNVDFDGYMTMIGMHDGVAHTDMSAFGNFDANTGQWVPKDPDTSGWSDNSFYLSGKETPEDDFCNLIKHTGTGNSLYINNISNGGIDFFANKRISTADSWDVGSTSRPSKHFLEFDTTDADSNNTSGAEFIEGGLLFGSSSRINELSSSYITWTMGNDPSKGFVVSKHTLTGTPMPLPHGLNGDPSVIILKRLDGIGSWFTWVNGVTVNENEYLTLNNGTDINTISGLWGATPADEANFEIGDYLPAGEYEMIAIANVAGYTYVGNFAADNSETAPLGFRPKVVITKGYGGTAGSWKLRYNINETGNDYVVLNSNSVDAHSSDLTLHSDGTSLIADIEPGAVNALCIAFADTTYLKEFSESDFGSIIFDSTDFPSWEKQYSDTPLNNHATLAHTTLGQASTLNGVDEGNMVHNTGGTSTAANNAVYAGSSMTYSGTMTGVYYSEHICNDSLSSGNVGLAVHVIDSDGYVATNINDSIPHDAGTVFGIYVNFDTKLMFVHKDGVPLSVEWDFSTFNLDGVSIMLGDRESASGTTWIANFGQKPFINPPNGVRGKDWKTLSSAGIVDTYPIINPKYFHDVFEWDGDGTDGKLITTGSVPPDIVFLKCVTDNEKWIVFGNEVGYNATDFFDGISMSALNVVDDNVVSVNGDNSFTVNSNNKVNKLGESYVAYVFRNSPCSGVIVQSGPSASMIEYPDSGMRLRKNYDSTGHWDLTSPTDIFDDCLRLDTTNLPTSESVPASLTNELRIDFFKVPGFSDFGIYKGNGNANGTFTYTNFKPRMLIRKRITSAVGKWGLCGFYDGINPRDNELALNASDSVSTGSEVDFLSNGFKNRHSSERNSSGHDYLYISFSESPFGVSTAC